ncbi:hypothetical protein EDC04DRAFT_2894711 [Pisolithus marmoratus]|nr:hypothetical protein EDC04DRAFT_2894711 [Pisolithus marmoratus]
MHEERLIYFYVVSCGNLVIAKSSVVVGVDVLRRSDKKLILPVLGVARVIKARENPSLIRHGGARVLSTCEFDQSEFLDLFARSTLLDPA